MPKQNMTAEQRRAATQLDKFVIKALQFYRNAPTGAAQKGNGLPSDKATDAILTEKGKCDAVVTIINRRIASRMSERLRPLSIFSAETSRSNTNRQPLTGQ